MDFILIFFEQFATIDMWIAFIVGIGGGIFIGAMPGMGATMAVALLIPVTFGMNAISGITMLTSTFAACTFGGSITAILLNTPGTLANAATAFDGYPMTQQGKGLQAIGWATSASLIGGVISAIAVLVVSPLLARAALEFSSPEYFLLALMGLTLIGGLGEGSAVRGIASGVFGMMIAIIGMEVQTGYARFIFNSTSLMGGVGLIPAMIGFFSVVQIMLMSEKLGTPEGMSRGQVLVENMTSGSRMLPKLVEFIKHLPNTLISSIVGVLVGILPGVGGNIACFVSYSAAKKVSKKPEEFGKGSVDGIIAPEAANNGVTGGSFIPLFTLGIPGSGTAAVLLGGLIVHGLNPGPSLFTKQAHILYPIMIAFLVANIITFFACAGLARTIAKSAQVPMNILAPLIIVACMVGSYSMSSNMFEVYLTIGFGLLAYTMVKLKFPVAPAVLGLILGPMAEEGLNSSIIMSKGNVLRYYLGRPLCVAFAVVILISLTIPFLQFVIQKVKRRDKILVL